MAGKMGEEDVQGYRVDAQLLSDLWIFRMAARVGSITGAASRLGVTQGAVSQRVIRLEGRLGTTLFSRKKGRLVLTSAGENLLGTMNEVATKLNGALSRFDRVRRSSLVVSCLPSLAMEWLVPRLQGFYQENPDIELFIRGEFNQATAERMEDKGIDVLICYQNAPTEDVYELGSFQEMIVPVCSRSYKNAMNAETEDTQFIRLHDDAPWDDVPWQGRPTEVEWESWQSARPQWRGQIVGDRHFNLSHLAYHAALSDQGVAIGRTVLVNRLINRGELIAATSLKPAPGGKYRIVANRPGDARSAVRKFANWVVQAMKDTQKETLSKMASAAE
ncbi:MULTISPECIES: LysR family transcriptional regulator [Asticcacaulis]|uniref:LysR family transcriptional regulator n=1 Tax=Asticcacaulis TaxID=76890 RepID=UPI001AE273CA|nr:MULTISPECIES: LysR family transcriptional regulator [Asticcacaulis]MBP2158732.1 DNA-binding transcriptional LysR family regulator [Asticcacaulis solisilvae]MDR6799778.1 DNA-binding transcriptional LysR family regulator [Asticcacaulis sp. BE141]